MDVGALLRNAVGRLLARVDLPTAVAIFVIVLLVSITTRAGSARSGVIGKDGVREPSMPGYWLPTAGHALQLNYDHDGFLAAKRKLYPEGIFSLFLHNKIHTFLSRPAFMSQLLSQPPSVANSAWISRGVSMSVFGFRRDKDLILDENLGHEGLTTKKGISDLTKSILNQLKDHVANWVTFNSWPIDQMDWERLASAKVIETEGHEPVMEVDLMELTRNFVARTVGAAVFGADFVENLSEFWNLLWIIDESFRTLALKLPVWAPWPKFQRAQLARRKMVALASEFETEMDTYLSGEEPSLRWHDLGNVSLLVRARIEQSRKQERPIEGRARSDLSLAFATIANLAPLTTWMLYEISKDATLLAEIREEIAPFVEAVQPKSQFGLETWVAPKIAKLDLVGLETKCPLLMAAYVETLRVYTASWLIRWMAEDVTVKDEAKPGDVYVLKKGTCVHVPLGLHQLDGAYFENPEQWQARRHVKEETDAKGKKVRTASMGTIKPFGKSRSIHPSWLHLLTRMLILGDGPSACKGKEVAQREMLAYTAVILSLYDITSPKGKPWKKTKLRKSSGTRYPKRPLRVWIKRRELSREE